MDGLFALVVFVALVVVVVVGGIRLGMLVAPRIERLSGRTEEEQGGDDD